MSGAGRMNVGAAFPLLSIHDDGIWYSGETGAVSYPDNDRDDYYLIEEASYWFSHRNECLGALLEAFPPENGKTICDIGGGNGVVSKELMKRGYNPVLIEPGARGASNAKNRGIADVICSSLEMTGGGSGSLPNAGLFDVAEHVKDDACFLKTVAEMLAPRGHLYMTVPALPSLWSEEDTHAGHFRRYRWRELVDKLHAARFSVLYMSAIFAFLPVPIFLFRTLPSRLGVYRRPARAIGWDHRAPRGELGRIMQSLLDEEVRRIRHGAAIRYGGSYIIAARRVDGAHLGPATQTL